VRLTLIGAVLAKKKTEVTIRRGGSMVTRRDWVCLYHLVLCIIGLGSLEKLLKIWVEGRGKAK
jgi:hypothetical protein